MRLGGKLVSAKMMLHGLFCYLSKSSSLTEQTFGIEVMLQNARAMFIDIIPCIYMRHCNIGNVVQILLMISTHAYILALYVVVDRESPTVRLFYWR